MNNPFSQVRRKCEDYRAILRRLLDDLFCSLAHDPAAVGRILSGQDVPSEWVEPTLEQLPREPDLHRKVLASAGQFARSFAHGLLQNTARRNQLNSTIASGQARQSAALQDGDAARAALTANRPAVRSKVAQVKELHEQISLVKAARREHLQRAYLWYGATGALVGAETAIIAITIIQASPEMDTGAKINVWATSGTVSGAFAWVTERGLRPLMEPAGNGSGSPLAQTPVRIALVALVSLTVALAGIRVEGVGEGGPTDLFHFILMVVAAPFLALWSGICSGRGRRQLQLAEGEKQKLVSLEQELIQVNTSFVEMEIEEEDQEAAVTEANERYQQALAEEARATEEKRALLQEIFDAVASHPDTVRSIDALASEAAELDLKARPVSLSGGVTSVLLCLLLAIPLSGCSDDMKAALGGPRKTVAIEVLLDRTHSLAEREPFRAAVEKEHATFVRTAPFGSRLEVWTIGGVPGEPRAVCSFFLLKVKPRDRKRVQAEEHAQLATALESTPTEKPRWSSILEDSYRLGERVSALPADHRCVVVMSDLLQYTPRLTTSQIIGARDQEALLRQALRDYPPFPHTLDEVRLLYLPGRAGKQPLSPRDAQRVKEFWRELWTRWGAREVRLTEPELSIRGGKERK